MLYITPNCSRKWKISPVFDVIFSSSGHQVAAEFMWKRRSRTFWKRGDVGTRSSEIKTQTFLDVKLELKFRLSLYLFRNCYFEKTFSVHHFILQSTGMH